MPDDPSAEPLGRIAYETETAWRQEQEFTRRKPWNDLSDEQREPFMRIGSAVAAQAVHDAGLRNDRMETQLSALGAHRGAVFDALKIAITASGYEHQRKRYRAALKALGGDEEPSP